MIFIILNTILKTWFKVVTNFYDLSETPLNNMERGQWKDAPWKDKDPIDNEKMVMVKNKRFFMFASPQAVSSFITKDSYSNGTTSAVIKFSSTRGAWGSFWTIRRSGTILPEYDFEHCGEWDNYVTATAHWGESYCKEVLKSSRMNRITGGKLFRPTEKFYRYTFKIKDGIIRWYIGGKLVKILRSGSYPGERDFLLTNTFGIYCDELKVSSNSMTVNRFDHEEL